MSIVGQRAGLERIELAPFTGVEGDFVRTVIQGIPSDTNLLDRREWSHELAMTLHLLEDLMGGSVAVKRIGPGRPVIMYQRNGLDLPMERSSSMVAELAGIALWIKAFLRRGDLLIIDEPEAHLHPENQLLIAKVLVRLANAGVRVIATTHSSIILHQVSNCMMASRLGAEQRDSLGLTNADVIPFDHVAAFLFSPHSDGTRTSPVHVDPEFGFSEEEFVRVAEAMGEETYNLKVAAMDTRLVHAGDD